MEQDPIRKVDQHIIDVNQDTIQIFIYEQVFHT